MSLLNPSEQRRLKPSGATKNTVIHFRTTGYEYGIGDKYHLVLYYSINSALNPIVCHLNNPRRP